MMTYASFGCNTRWGRSRHYAGPTYSGHHIGMVHAGADLSLPYHLYTQSTITQARRNQVGGKNDKHIGRQNDLVASCHMSDRVYETKYTCAS
jgi:hypothetical protein